MKYYKLTTIGVNRTEIGISPQSTECYFGDIQKDFIPFEGKIGFDFDLPIPKLQDKAKLSTFLNVVAIPNRFIVVNSQFVNFLKKFEIGEYQYWPIDVHHRKSVVKDFCLFILNETKQIEYVNFKKSEFYIGNLKDHSFVGDNINICSYNNYLNTREILKSDGLWLKNRKLKLDLRNAKEDLFRIINVPNGGYFVSHRLKSAIEEKRYTGLIFKDITDNKKVDVMY